MERTPSEDAAVSAEEEKTAATKVLKKWQLLRSTCVYGHVCGHAYRGVL